MHLSPCRPDTRAADSARDFRTTRWTVVLAAAEGGSPSAEDALAQLCRTYWYPLYAFVRRRGYDAHEAQDLTQEFFALLLEKHGLERVDRASPLSIIFEARIRFFS